MLALKFLLTLLFSYLGVVAQGQFPVLTQWILIYLTVFLVSWFGGLINGMISTVFSLTLAALMLIPRGTFSLADLTELFILTCLGFWISFSMDQYKRSLVKLSHSEQLEKLLGFTDTLLENIPMMIFVKDARELKFVKFNKFGLEILGHEVQDLIGKSDFDFFPVDQARQFVAHDQKVLQEGLILDIPYEVVDTKFKGQRILHTKKIPIIDKNGKPLYLLGVSEDITEKYEAEQLKTKFLAEESARHERLRMLESENLVAQVISTLSESLDYQETLKRLVNVVVPALGDWASLIIENDQGALERVACFHQNPALKETLEEYNQDYPPGQKDTEINRAFKVGQASLVNGIDERFLREHSPNERKFELFELLGTSSGMVIPVKTRNRILGVITISRGKERPCFDELDLAMAEEIGRRAGAVLENSLLFRATQKAVRVRDEFLAIASHELKTPITSLKLQLQLLQRSKADPTILKPVNSAIKQVDRLTLLVNDLLEVGRIESGSLSYQFQKIPLAALVLEVAENFKVEFERVNSVLTVEIIDEPVVEGDIYRLEQVIVNLLSNARKYGNGKPVRITLSATADESIIAVRDSGQGIPVEDRNKVFEKFERGKQDLNISGLGLGLFISQAIVLAHGGRIDLESQVNEGSVFKIILNRASAH